MAAGDAIFHFAFIQHTASAVHNKGIRRKIFGKSAAGGKLKFKVLAGVFADTVFDDTASGRKDKI